MKLLMAAGALVIFLGLALLILLPPRVPKNVKTIRELEVYLDRLVASRQPPGISLVVTKDDQVVYSHSAGMADAPGGAQAVEQTIYHWWSMTKVATAVAVMQLHEQGKLDIDDPVAKYVPYFAAGPEAEELKAITIRQVLRHTSGLPDMIPALIGWVHYEDEIYSQTEILERIMPEYGRLSYTPDEASRYSNFGYLVLGVVIENVSGQTYEDYIVEHVLQPAGMDMTGFLYSTEMDHFEAAGSHPLMSMYTPMLPFLLNMKTFSTERQGAVLWLNRVYLDVTPSSGLIGSVQDAAKFMLAYNLSAENFLSDASKMAMRPSGKLPTERPIGWAEFSRGEREWLQHRGGGPGFATIMRIYPEESLGIVVMANGTNMPAEKIVEALSKLSW